MSWNFWNGDRLGREEDEEEGDSSIGHYTANVLTNLRPRFTKEQQELQERDYLLSHEVACFLLHDLAVLCTVRNSALYD